MTGWCGDARTLDLSFLTWLFVMETVIGILWRDQGQVWWITDTSCVPISLLSPIAQMIISFLNKTFSIRFDTGIERRSLLDISLNIYQSEMALVSMGSGPRPDLACDLWRRADLCNSRLTPIRLIQITLGAVDVSGEQPANTPQQQQHCSVTQHNLQQHQHVIGLIGPRKRQAVASLPPPSSQIERVSHSQCW